ncbi:ABC transporter substrate-binding protein [Frankia sp. CNm7]|uniref:ABC transporter substrate-binding protein n=1 Tax=Frankia nepalensis TaxID=1836974 RepID=A0A937RBI8_9ACTN|nr:ABC transporter substrate-binding protein [Frankia nepalensis]MBL7496671.1 ABC transporter substrate-binding protein [Frankia nepalensis]MBL7510687.1 ABC transporter substrate-binding protein [Frankia nepalensis]MBL7516680.1 ABC transporter substrate-binding protein [Frankia nepalensis]MBL7627410.1 ABC transporter substrate-binding protein [Frankia nepalensis]
MTTFALLAAVLAGCADGSSDPSGDGAGGCVSPGVTADTIRIGLIYPDSGAVVGGFQATPGAVAARIEAANAAGGVNGRKVIVDWRDDQGTADVFSLAAHDLLDDSDGQGVLALLAQTIALTPASFDWLAKAGVPVVGVATSAEWSNYPNAFHFGNIFNQNQAVTTYGQFANAQGASKVFVLTDQQAQASASLAAHVVTSLQSQNVQVVGTLDITKGISSPARVADAIRDSGANGVIGTIQADPFYELYPLLGPLRLKLAMNATGYDADILASQGQALAGMTVVVSYSAFGTEAMNTYLRNVDTYAPELTNPQDQLALAGYVAADEMLLGLSLAGDCPTREKFIEGLRQVPDYTAGGLIPPNDIRHPADPARCVNFVQVSPSGDQWQVISDPARSDGYWCGDVITTGTTTG